MSAAVMPGTPSPASPAAPPSAPAGQGQLPANSVEHGAAEADSGETGDIVSDARKKARELLFSTKTDAEVDEEAEGHVKKKPEVKVEAKKEPEKPKEDPDIEVSRRFAKVHAQETRLKERQKELLTEKETFSKEKESILKEKQELEAMRNDPVGFMAKAGWTKEKIVEWIQGDGRVDPEILVKQLDEKHQRELAELRAERQREKEAYETEQQDRQRKRDMERVEGELYTEVKSLVDSDGELGTLKRYIAKKPEKNEAVIQRRVGSIIAECWKRTFNKGENEGLNKGTVVDPRDALLYLQQELAELQLEPGQAPAVKPANPAAVEPSPITNHATSQRTIQNVEYDETDPEARRARAAAILAGEIEAD
jgi:hypothetical protein